MFRLLLLCFFLATRLSGQDSCAEMLLLADADVSLEYTMYDRKGNECGKVSTKVILVEETKQGTIFHFESNMTPIKGTLADRQLNTYYIRCYKDTLYTSMSSMLPAGTLESYKSMQLQMESNDLRMPRHPKEDSELPAGDMSVQVTSNGAKVLSLKANTNKRKVEKKESVTTPAGTFDCVKVSETTEVKIGFITNKISKSTWYAPGMGMIKQETYDKKGKLDSRVELQKKV